MTQKDSDLQKIKELLKIMKDNDLLELEIRHGDDQIVLKRSGPAPGPTVTSVPFMAANMPAGASAADTNGQAAQAHSAPGVSARDNIIEITSPIVGTLYSAPSPDSDPFVEVGSRVDEQSVVCIIEAMKVMNEIRAETSGTIVEVLAKTGEAVEYGQLLFRLKPD